jgi:hypothetical protein
MSGTKFTDKFLSKNLVPGTNCGLIDAASSLAFTAWAFSPLL